VVTCVVRVKTPARTVLTCDAGSLAGLPPGRYRNWGQDLEVLPGGKIVVPGTPYLAGSGNFTDVCVGNVVRMAGVSLKDAVEMATARPRELLGLPVPTIAVGQPADLVVFEWAPGGDVAVTGVTA
jgi:N-acetylglucosamine-6-phosphate deacetylase